MTYEGNIPRDLKDMYRAIGEEYIKKHPEIAETGSCIKLSILLFQTH